jgi:hypothetical protein
MKSDHITTLAGLVGGGSLSLLGVIQLVSDLSSTVATSGVFGQKTSDILRIVSGLGIAVLGIYAKGIAPKASPISNLDKLE